ncbi:MAG: hypothetical protein Q8922_12040 [Bacteroidota bacterium]|nr:hypothetical protein [Bacteroidota bacterium]MDP4233312.1 hypothetical protein [Bacteroidota bacterium]MDP4242068.1 hypothetical protein [Bacteroidota bacterium]MDP4288654.1 hypothetical protein [Bacteroidota bacterium]
MRQSYLILIALLAIYCDQAPVALAQSEADPLAAHIGVTARATGDSIILRWGPSNTALWLGGNESGYVIERSVAGENRFTQIGALIKPWPRNRWVTFLTPREAAATDDSAIDYAQIAYSLLYDSAQAGVGLHEGFEDEKEIGQKQASLDMSRSFALIAADRDAETADGLGLRFVDRNVQRGMHYTYRVRLQRALAVYHADTGSVTIENVPYNKALSRKPITPIEGDRTISLNWQASPKLGSYIVSRSEDGGKSFRRLNRLPLITIRQSPLKSTDSESYLDTAIVNYRPYVYRISGTTSFADVEIVGEVHAMGRDLTPPGMPLLHQPKQTTDRTIEVTWEMASPVAQDLAGFRVLRGETDSGEFTAISEKLPPATRSFTDAHFSDTVHNYYVIECFDTARNRARSFAVYAPLQDTTPPASPAWLSGSMDTNGIVTLKLKGNTERDLMGYRLLRANGPEHEFSVIQESYADPDAPEARRATYHDTVTLQTLTPYVYYRAVALDRNYNESPLSAVLAVPRPDRIPPVPPVITDVMVTDSNVTIDFIPSSSKDVRTQLLLRRESGATAWETASELTAADQRAMDKDVKANVSYEYALQAVDTTGNHSKLSGSVTARPYRRSVIDGVRDLRAVAVDSGRAVQLSWTNPTSGPLRIIIYRGMGDHPIEQYAQLPDGGSQFVDRVVTHETSYTYAIKAFDSNGTESRLSYRVIVTAR